MPVSALIESCANKNPVVKMKAEKTIVHFKYFIPIADSFVNFK